MKSNAQKIKKSYKKLLDDGKRHGRKELFDYARKDNPGEKFSDGMLTGSLKTLTDPGTGYSCVERGIYQKDIADKSEIYKGTAEDVINEYQLILQEALDETNKISVNPMIILGYDEMQRKKLEEIQKCIQMIRETIQKVK